MSVEIVFPLEFVVPGTPLSLQSKRQTSRQVWKERVKQASYASLPEGHFMTDRPIAVTLYYFPSDRCREI